MQVNNSSIVLINPKYPRNVGTIVRTASCFGIKHVFYTGNRISLDLERKKRLPREERMKGYKEVNLCQTDRPFDYFPREMPIVAVELVPGAMQLQDFEHPENATYVFGPEDGGIPKAIRVLCHRFIVIPSRHCFNLATAVSITMWDRCSKLHHSGKEIIPDTESLLINDRACLRDTHEYGIEGLVH